ncbi:energy-coupling factor transporter transmembrane component T family protein [Pyrococcus abyssi]|uniref:Cobalt transport protein n=1 Tax=Pyrococcus abyssi (strain GE5 / Orsay) TaxID=272844 RepID=Q9V2E5_PYRAB|nr:energy-coupling factor transporter transmembrane protein EcfT [Pyrococcus abyssi]CAB49053.1 Cobalt transport protein, cbiQ family [Pyrococcus abyssi GE5]CCE69505.1 TPA: cobalt transport protein [Pyrococcus abyssi GE5]
MMYSLYVERKSLLHSLDPRVKIIGIAVFGTIGMLTRDPIASPVIFVLTLLGLKLLGKLDVKVQLKALKPLIPIFILTFISWPIVAKPLERGILLGIAYTFRIMGITLMAFGLMMTTRQRDLIRGFTKLGLPYEIGLTVLIALRYVPTLHALANNIMDAQKSRGLELEKGNFLERSRKMIAIVIPLLVLSIRTAHELAMAMESRAFGASKRRTHLTELKMKRKDYVALAVVFTIALLYLSLKFSLLPRL